MTPEPPTTGGPPIVLQPQALDVLHSFRNEVGNLRERERFPFYDSIAEWERDAKRRFGADKLRWRWECPECGWVASALDYLSAGAPQHQVGFACVGRFAPASQRPTGPCNYSGADANSTNPVTVRLPGRVEIRMLRFAGG